MSAALTAFVASHNPNLPPFEWFCCRSEFMGCLALHVGKGEKETLRQLNQTRGAKKTLWSPARSAAESALLPPCGGLAPWRSECTTNTPPPHP